jgi:RNA polymerase sigma-70 factor (ECF subfamily)
LKASAMQWKSWTLLMKLVQEGDQDAYQTLLTEIGPIIYSFVRNRVFNRNLVDDAYQEVLFTLHEARHTYLTDRPFAPWLFTIARNSVWETLGKNRKFAENELLMETLPDLARREEEDGQLEDGLFQALEGLPEKFREPVKLLKLEGLTLEEAAKKLGLNVGTLKVRAHRGYRALKKALLKNRVRK